MRRSHFIISTVAAMDSCFILMGENEGRERIPQTWPSSYKNCLECCEKRLEQDWISAIQVLIIIIIIIIIIYYRFCVMLRGCLRDDSLLVSYNDVMYLNLAGWGIVHFEQSAK